MKLFHLADLHIGKKVNGYSMIDDQRFVLDQVIARIRAEQPDALILAGDIYDRQIAPTEAIRLFDSALSRLMSLGTKVCVISERLGFANAIQAKAGLHLAGAFSWPLPKVRLTDADGPVDVYLMAYADLAVLHQLVPETEDMDYAHAMDHVLSRTALDPAARNVLVAHGVVTGDETLATCDSERTLSIGGTEFWQSASLAAFDYVALGHLHQAQRAGSDRIRYAGSLLHYSFSEENQQKVMLSVQLSADGALQIEALPLNPLRRLVTVRGMLENLLTVPPELSTHRDDYLRVVLEDAGSLLEPMQRLKSCYPHIMLLERASELSTLTDQALPQAQQIGKKRTPLEMFTAFYEQVTDAPADDELCALMQEIFEEVQKETL